MMAGKVAVVAGYGDVGKGTAASFKGAGAIVTITEIDPICALQAAMEGFEVTTVERVLNDGHIFVTTTGNKDVLTKEHMYEMKDQAIVCNIGHFDNEIDTQYMRDEWQWEEVKPQVHKISRSNNAGDYLILLAEGRLVNLGNATGHPSRIMDGSFANQVLAQMFLYKQAFATINDEETKKEMLKIEVLPMELDEEVASYMVEGFGGVVTKLTKDQADYILSLIHI